jgi:peptide/nickel transport system substrate-binding protein
MRSFWLHTKNFFQNLWSGIKLLPQIKRQQIPHLIENFTIKELYTMLVAAFLLLLSGGFLINSILVARGPGPRYGGELIEGLVGQPQYINPILAVSNSVDSDISRLVFAQILKFDASGNLVPDLAQGIPEISKDQKTYTLKLKPNLKWQDGKPLNADDVLFTIQAIQNTQYESPLEPNWGRVKVDKIDDLTLTFKLREVSDSFMDNFAVGILPKHVWEEISPANFKLTDNNLKAMGAGPYTVSQISKTASGAIKSISLQASKQYYQGLPYISTIMFKFYSDYDSLVNAYQGKDIQSLGFVPFDRKAFTTASIQTNQYKFNLPQYQAVFFNQQHAIMNDKSVRQALWLTTNRQSIIDDVYAGNASPIYGPILPESLGYNPAIEKTVHTDLTEAANILTKGGWILDPTTNIRVKNKTPLAFNLVTSDSQVLNTKTAQILQTQWQSIGAKINLILVGSKELEQDYIRPRKFDALLFSENVGADPDPFAFWDSSQSHDPGLNLSEFSNAEADKLLTEARQTADINVRVKDYQRFQEIINSELPAIFLIRTVYIYDVPKKVQGIDLTNIISPAERFLDVNHWYLAD